MGLIEEAKAEIARRQAEADAYTQRSYFVGDPPEVCVDRLTPDEYAAAKRLAAGKSIPEKALDKDHESRFKNGGLVSTAEAVARCL